MPSGSCISSFEVQRSSRILQLFEATTDRSTGRTPRNPYPRREHPSMSAALGSRFLLAAGLGLVRCPAARHAVVAFGLGVGSRRRDARHAGDHDFLCAPPLTCRARSPILLAAPWRRALAGIGFVTPLRCMFMAWDSGIEADALQPMELGKIQRAHPIALLRSCPACSSSRAPAPTCWSTGARTPARGRSGGLACARQGRGAPRRWLVCGSVGRVSLVNTLTPCWRSNMSDDV
jgi:hypothetical protein